MSVTPDTSHLEISALKARAPENIECMSVTPLGQSPAGEIVRQELSGCWSSVLDCGENRVLVPVAVDVAMVTALGQGFHAILPDERLNIWPLPRAFELTQAAPQSTWSNDDAW